MRIFSVNVYGVACVVVAMAFSRPISGSMNACDAVQEHVAAPDRTRPYELR